MTNVNASCFSLVSAINGANYPLATGGVSYNSTTHIATFQLANDIVAPDKLILTISDSVTDIAGNTLDGEWTNPTSLGSTGTSTFPSGNGSPGSGAAGGFKFYFVVLPGDYNRNNYGDSADYVVWSVNNGTGSGATFTMGDGDGDGDVDTADYNVWRSVFGINFTTW